MSVGSRSVAPFQAGRRLRCPRDAFLLFEPLLAGLPRERVAVAYLCRDGALLRVDSVAEGCAAAATLPGPEILRRAVASEAAGILLAHNHPSGDATPSLADIRTTRGLAAGARAVEIRVIDHVVIARGEARSFRLMGLM